MKLNKSEAEIVMGRLVALGSFGPSDSWARDRLKLVCKLIEAFPHLEKLHKNKFTLRCAVRYREAGFNSEEYYNR